MTELRITQATIASGCLQEYNRIQRWNTIPYLFVKWVKIVKVYPSLKDREMIFFDEHPRIAFFVYLVFDYEYIHSSVVKVSEQVKTSSFETDFSLN